MTSSTGGRNEPTAQPLSLLQASFSQAFNSILDEQSVGGRGLWTKVKCDCGQLHSWDEYLLCEKANLPEVLRWSLRPRGLETGVYHVTELINPRYSFYERTTDFSDTPTDKMHFFVGKAIHIALQENFPRQWCEVPVRKNIDVDGEQVQLVGHVDAIDPQSGKMWELKSISSTLWKKRFGVDKRHVWQVSAYWHLFREQNPTMAGRMKDAVVAYLSKAREYKVSPWMEFHSARNEFYLERPPLEERTIMLHRALKTGVPPPHICDDYTTIQVKPYVSTERYPCKACKFKEACVAAFEKNGRRP